MKQEIAHVALLVKDYDEAIAYYTQVLNFELQEDSPLSESKRWVRVRPPGSKGTSLLLARAVGEEQEAALGRQGGGRVFLFLYTDDFWRDYKNMQAKGVHFVRPAVQESWGMVAVFSDLYGNLWDLIQPAHGED